MLNNHTPPNYAVTTRSKLVADMLELRANGHTWQQIGDHYGITKAMVYRVALQEYDPVDLEIRQRLGLDAPILTGRFLEDRLRWVLDLCEVHHA